MVIKELITVLGFKIEDEKLENFEKSVQQVTTGLIALTGAAAAAVAGLFAMAKSAANSGDEIAKTAPLVGLSIENFQKYRYAADLAGVANEAFTTSLQLFTRNIGDAVNGVGEAAKAFPRLGVSMALLKSGNTDAIIRQVAEGLSRIPNPTERAALSMDLFGRSGLRMGQFLALGVAELDKIGAEAEAFGLFDAESAKAAEEFGDSISRLLFVFQGIKNEIGIRLFPVFQRMTDQFREWLLVNREVIRLRLERFAALVTSALEFLWKVMEHVGRAGLGLVRILGGLENVVKLVGVALAALFSASVVAAIKSGIVLIQALGSAFLVTWAKALIVPLAIGAAVAAAILLFEELHGWVTGSKETLLEGWLGSFDAFKNRVKGIVEEIKDIFRGLAEWMKGVFTGDWDRALDGMDKSMEAAANALMKSVDLVTGGRGPIGGPVDSQPRGMLSAFAMPYGMALPTKAPARLAPLIERFAPQDGGSSVGVMDNPAPLARSAVVNNSGGNVDSRSYKTEVNVTVPPGTPDNQARFIEETAKKVFHEEQRRSFDHALQSNPRRK